MKEKTIKELNKIIKLHLKKDKLNRREYNRNQNDFWYQELIKERIIFSYLMQFANNILGRREVNKLCNKYDIRNRY